MKADPVKTRVVASNGAVALSVGFSFVLFMRKAHWEIAADVVEALRIFNHFVGEDSLQWLHDRGEYFRPYTRKREERLIETLLAPAAKDDEPMFKVKGGCGESDAAAFGFEYSGTNMQGRLADVSTSSLHLSVPVEFAQARGWAQVSDFFLTLADRIPFTSGYGSLALQREPWAVAGTEDIAIGLLARHPGLDLNSTANTALRIGNAARGAYWLTLLSTQLLLKIATSPDEIATKLHPGTTMRQLATGVAIQAGEEPLSGDVNRGDRLPLVRAVAAAIEPVRHTQRVAIFGYQELEDFVAWQERHIR